MLSGVYYHKAPDSSGCHDDKSRSHSILRFFPDGTVVSASVVCQNLEQDWAQIENWLTDRHATRGTYRIDDGTIAFTITSTHESKVLGTVEYMGQVRDSALVLNWRSNITGAVRNGVEYLPLTGIQPHN